MKGGARPSPGGRPRARRCAPRAPGEARWAQPFPGLLKAALAGRPVPYDDAELTELARHCTEQEDNAARVERQEGKSAAAVLLQDSIGQRFDAIVTGASEKGTWVRIFRAPVEGKLIRGALGLDVGDRLRVELVHTDVERGFIDFVRAA